MWPGDASEDNSAGRCGLQDGKWSATATAQMDETLRNKGEVQQQFRRAGDGRRATCNNQNPEIGNNSPPLLHGVLSDESGYKHVLFECEGHVRFFKYRSVALSFGVFGY
jgi:hypothetical protein